MNINCKETEDFFQGKCIKKCKTGKIRNEKGRCILAKTEKKTKQTIKTIKTIKNKILIPEPAKPSPVKVVAPEPVKPPPIKVVIESVKKPCKPGKIRNEKGRCVTEKKTIKNKIPIPIPEPVKVIAPEPVKVIAPEPVKVIAPEPVKVIAPEPVKPPPIKVVIESVKKPCKPGKIRNEKGRCVTEKKTKQTIKTIKNKILITEPAKPSPVKVVAPEPAKPSPVKVVAPEPAKPPPIKVVIESVKKPCKPGKIRNEKGRCVTEKKTIKNKIPIPIPEPIKVVAPEPIKVVAPEPIKVIAPEPIKVVAPEPVKPPPIKVVIESVKKPCKPGKIRNEKGRCVTEIQLQKSVSKIQATIKENNLTNLNHTEKKTIINIPKEQTKLATSTEEKSLFDLVDSFQKIGKEKYENIGIEYINRNYLLYPLLVIHLIKKYNANCLVLEKKNFVGVPIFNFRTKEHPNIKKSRDREIYKLIRQLLSCIKNNRNNPDFVAIIPITIQNIDDLYSHANMLIYRHRDATIEHFEPHGNSIYNSAISKDARQMYILLRKAINKMNTLKNGVYDKNITYKEPNEVCPNIQGLQFMEGIAVERANKALLQKEGNGFCIMWSIFYAELCLLNPSMSGSKILKLILGWIKEKKNFMYVRNIIRGYIHKIYEDTAEIIKRRFNMSMIEFQNKTITNIVDNEYTLLYKYILEEYRNINKVSFFDNVIRDNSISISL